MNDFLDCCKTMKAELLTLENRLYRATDDRDRVREQARSLLSECRQLEHARDSACEDIRSLTRQRDDARLEADRLRAEVPRLVKERDECAAEAGKLREVARWVECIAEIVADYPRGGRDDAWYRLARIGLAVGRIRESAAP